MDNCNLIFSSNKTDSCTICFDKGMLTIKLKKKKIDGSDMMKVVRHINVALSKYNNIAFDVTIYIDSWEFKDKLTYITLECIVYSIIADFKKRVFIAGGKEENNQGIITSGFAYSPINLLKKTNNKKSMISKCNEYVANFDKKIIYKNHYRNMISSTEKMSTFGVIQHEIRTFLFSFLENVENSKEVAEVACELLGNAYEHTKSDCLIDIDVTDNKIKVGDSSKKIYHGINIAIINFSDKLFGDSLKEKMNSDIWRGLLKYEEIKNAYNNHKRSFDQKYDEEDFYNIASLQDKISGRFEHSVSGGTGLTQLIHSAETRSDSHYCYLLSGKKVVNFIPDFLKNSGGWVGFNNERDFINCRPAVCAITYCDLFIPGTAFNLTFVM